MRFNGKELAALALQPSHKFDKEGPLLVREKQEGLFRRSEVSTERWCRLRGNMLFYFKSRDQYSEPAGVIVLEQCDVQLDKVGDEGPFSFSIVFDGGDVGGCALQFCAASESERDAWIQALHMASYEYMRTQLRALNDKLDEKNRIDEDNSSSGREVAGGGSSGMAAAASSKGKVVTDFTEGPYLEMSLACDNLMCDGDGQPPNPVVLVSLVCPGRAQWTTYAQTEFIERSSNPCFLTTINFRLSDVQTSGTKIKLSVYDVRERLTSTMTLLGSALFKVDDLDVSDTFRLALTSGVGVSVGFITVTAWFVTPDTLTAPSVESFSPNSNETTRSMTVERSKQASAVAASSSQLRMQQQQPSSTSTFGNLNILFDNVVTQSYRFHTGLGADLSVQEIMAECKLGFTFPQSVIELFIRDEKQILHFLSGLGDLKDEWSRRQADLIERHLHLINIYTVALQNLDSHSGSNIKPSCDKCSSELEFVPVNLHLQRISVHNDSIKKFGTYDVFTVGAFTAHARRFRHGGLHRILSQMKQSRDDKADKASIAAEAVARIRQLKTSLEGLTDELLRLAGHRTSSAMCLTMTDISTKAHHLIGICDPSLVEEASTLLDGMCTPKTDDVGVTGTMTTSEIDSPDLTKTERSKSLDGHQLSTLLGMQAQEQASHLLQSDSKQAANNNNMLLLASKKSDYKKEFGSPRSGRRRSLRPTVTRHGSLKEESIHSRIGGAGGGPHNHNHQQQQHHRTLSGHIFPTKSLVDTSNKLVLVNNAKNEDDFGEARCKSPEEPEPWDLTQLNIEASVMCMASKVKSLSRSARDTHKDQQTGSAEVESEVDWVLELRPSVRKLTQALDCLWRTANMTHVTYLLMEPLQASLQQTIVQHRRDVVFANMLTAIVTALLARFWCQRVDIHQVTRFAKHGCLAQFEGLLSCHGDEMGMLEDMMVAIDDMARVTFRLEAAAPDVTSPIPTIEGSRLLMTVNLPVPELLLTAETSATKGVMFHVTPAFFNVGINEQATIAERETCNPSCMQSVPLSARKSITCMHAAAPQNSANRFGDISLQDKINADGLHRLREFHAKYRQVPIVAADKTRRPSVCESATTVSVSELLDKLTVNVLHTKKGKNVEILHMAAQVCRLLNGLRFTSCKSAKDRTSMSVTLEQCTVLRENFDLAEHEFLRALECMRCEGTRRENTLKNAGVKKYAFNALQVMALPKLYRPPTGTYGNVQS